MTSVPYEYDCDKSTPFLPDPNQHKRIGYITEFNLGALDVPLGADLLVSVPYENPSGPPAHLRGYEPAQPGDASKLPVLRVVGVIEQFSWDGSVGGTIECDFYMSQENAVQIKTLQQSVLKSTAINSFAFWVGDYDQELKVWYEQAFPLEGKISGSITGGDKPELDVDLTAVPPNDGIDLYVYKVHVSVTPPADQQYALTFANSANSPITKNWGIIVGKLASQALTPTDPI